MQCELTNREREHFAEIHAQLFVVFVCSIWVLLLTCFALYIDLLTTSEKLSERAKIEKARKGTRNAVRCNVLTIIAKLCSSLVEFHQIK